MEIKHLKTFFTVARHLNFTRAANELCLAQSSVSAQVKALEDDLGVKLFDRLGRRVILTQPGKKLFEYTRRITDMTDEIRSELSRSTETTGHFTIRMPETLAIFFMPNVVKCFHKAYPKVTLSFINCSDLKLREELNTGFIDFAFLMSDTISFKEVHVEMLGELPLSSVCGADHPLTTKSIVTIEDLHQETVLLPSTD